MLLGTVFKVLYFVLMAYETVILIDIILSWIPKARESRVGSVIDTVAGWYMRIFRGWAVIGFLDFSPMIGIIVYDFIRRGILSYIP